MNIANNPKRGEVYFIRIPVGTTVAHEIRYSRPGVIVSTDALNSDSYTVNVVFLSTAAAERHDIPADRHPLVTANKLSAAICEQVSTVDVSRLGERICRLTDDEMKSVDSAILHCLGLSLPADEGDGVDLREEEAEIVRVRDQFSQFDREESSAVDALERELEVYKRLYAELLDRVLKSA